MTYYYYVTYMCTKNKKPCIGTAIVTRDRKISSAVALADVRRSITTIYKEKNVSILSFVLLKKDTDRELVDDLYVKKELLKSLYAEIKTMSGYKFNKEGKSALLSMIGRELHIKERESED